jgi:hypothetical protein
MHHLAASPCRHLTTTTSVGMRPGRRWIHVWQPWSSPWGGGGERVLDGPSSTSAQTTVGSSCLHHQIRSPPAALRHPRVKSGHFRVLSTNMKKRSPAATILAGPSGCAPLPTCALLIAAGTSRLHRQIRSPLAALRHPHARSGCRRLHVLSTNVKKRGPAATLRNMERGTMPSSSFRELHPETRNGTMEEQSTELWGNVVYATQ